MLELTWNTLGCGFAVAASLLLLIFFKELREKFKIRVNCWFCNENTSVPFPRRNSFVCPSCHQYNGFEEDGGYNKAIPEQYDEMLNSQQRNVPSGGGKQPAANGLCKLCNNNQQLKVYQLANFVPMNEDNYDMEIEHFQTQLEKAYKLCPKCDAVVKKTIKKQNRWMMGLKMKYLKEKGVQVLRKSRKELSEMQKSHLIFCSLFLFTVSGLYFSGFLKKLLVMVLLDVPKGLCAYLRDYGYHNVVNVFENHSEDYLKSVGENEIVLSWICAIALLLSVIYIVYTTKTAIKDTSHNSSNFYKLVNSTSQMHERILRDSYSDNEADKNSDLSCGDSDTETPKAKPRKSTTPKAFKPNGEYRNVPVFHESPAIKPHTNSAFQVFKQSPSKSLNDSFCSTRSFATVGNNDLNASLSGLKLGAKPLIAPGKLKNPWTGKLWEGDTVSQTSSQSSGFYSYADNCNSICGEFDCSSMYSEPVHKNAFKPVQHFDNKSNGNLHGRLRPLSLDESHSHFNAKSVNSNLEGRLRPLNLDDGYSRAKSVNSHGDLESRFRPLNLDNSLSPKFNPTHVNFEAHNSFSPLNGGRSLYADKFTPLNVGLDNKSIYASSENLRPPKSNKFQPLNVSLNGGSVFSHSSLKPGSIYCLGNKSERSFCPAERFVQTPVDFGDFAYQRKPNFWND